MDTICPDCNTELVRKSEFSKSINQNISFYECPSCKSRFKKPPRSNARNEDFCPDCMKPSMIRRIDKETGEEYKSCGYCGYEATEEDIVGGYVGDKTKTHSSSGAVIATIGFLIYLLFTGSALITPLPETNLLEYFEAQKTAALMALTGMVMFMLGCIIQFFSTDGYLLFQMRRKKE